MHLEDFVVCTLLCIIVVFVGLSSLAHVVLLTLDNAFIGSFCKEWR